MARLTIETSRDQTGNEIETSHLTGTRPAQPLKGCCVVPWSRSAPGRRPIFPDRSPFTANHSTARPSTAETLP